MSKVVVEKTPELDNGHIIMPVVKGSAKTQAHAMLQLLAEHVAGMKKLVMKQGALVDDDVVFLVHRTVDRSMLSLYDIVDVINKKASRAKNGARKR